MLWLWENGNGKIMIDKLNKILQKLLHNPIVDVYYTTTSKHTLIVKYKNGKMIVIINDQYNFMEDFKVATGGSYGTQINKLPPGFIDPPMIFIFPNSTLNIFISLNANNISTTQYHVSIARHFANSIPGDLYFKVLAIGRWK